MAITPQTDERVNELLGCRIVNSAWDGPAQRKALKYWLRGNGDDAAVGPEALANHASAEDCIGYPPVFIHTVEFDPDRDFSREFYVKVLEAKSFAEYHCWGGAHHASTSDLTNPVVIRMQEIIDANTEDLFQYDLRRPWVEEESKPSQQ